MTDTSNADPDRPAAVAGESHDDFGGLHRDLPRLLGRRRALQWVGGMSLAGVLAACGSSGDGGAATTSASSGTGESTTTAGAAGSTAAASDDSATVAASAGEEIPDETAGPYPADGSNGPNVLDEDGIVRTDMTASIGSLSGTADGVPLTFSLTVVDADTGDPLPGAAVYLWHCTADGQYSMYEVTDQNYLRAVQAADDSGKVTFTSVFPGCYRGRWPHAHFEVYESLDVATAGNQATKTSQLALPQSDCEAVYADDRYGNSADNLAQLSLASDNIFADGWDSQLATVSGSIAQGYTSSLLVRV